MFYRVMASLALLAFSGAMRAANTAPPGRPEPGRNFTVENLGIAMLWVAPGTFLLSGTHGAGDDTQVTLTRGYWLGRTEVTQGQWQAVMDYVPLPSFFKGSDRPVEQVGWEVAMAFCRRLTERERTAGRLPEGCEYTLPTEAQWEFACRAGTTGIYAGELAAMAWYDANSGGQTHPVAQKQPNTWGFFDMHGNVEEWCADWYGGYPGGRVNDPEGPAEELFRVLRGGSWAGPAGYCRSAFRNCNRGLVSNSGRGFRLALASRRSVPAPEKNAGN